MLKALAKWTLIAVAATALLSPLPALAVAVGTNLMLIGVAKGFLGSFDAEEAADEAHRNARRMARR